MSAPMMRARLSARQAQCLALIAQGSTDPAIAEALHGGFNETGAGALNLSASSESWTRLDTGIELGISHVVPTETGRLVLEGRAVWEHAFADVAPGQSLSFAGSPAGFDVRGPAASRDRLRIGAGLAWDVAPDMTVRANYDGLFSGTQSSHSGSICLNIRF